MKFCFASHNKNKIRELNQMLSGLHEIVGLNEIGVTEEIPETGETFSENSLIKAKYVFEKFHLPVFADDSGLEVGALNGEPGVFSARYAGPAKNDEENIQLLLKNLGSNTNRVARFKTVITLIEEDGTESQFSGTIEGAIIKEKRGAHGFGYDPIFIPNGHEKTFAELPSEIKNRISHRAVAVKKLIDHLKKATCLSQ